MLFGPGNGYPMATNIVLLLLGVVIIRFTIFQVLSLFRFRTDRHQTSHRLQIFDNIIHNRTVSDFQVKS